jgi:catechol 2,3-dioxygenase-like lactoylglutathione lyase family enzyme
MTRRPRVAFKRARFGPPGGACGRRAAGPSWDADAWQRGERTMETDGRFGLSHFELVCRDVQRMRDFYADVLGFAVTDEGGLGERRLVFLSRDPGEHHQLVLSGGRAEGATGGVLNHVSFRVGSLALLRDVLGRVQAAPHGPVEQVTHGTTWSVYFRDPEGNRLECFVDTPWYTPQPCREPLDFSRGDAEIRRETEALCRARPGFQTREAWLAAFAQRLGA